jgi:hypothetical protein
MMTALLLVVASLTNGIGMLLSTLSIAGLLSQKNLITGLIMITVSTLAIITLVLSI